MRYTGQRGAHICVENRGLTRVKRIRDSVEHVGVHVGVDGPVRCGSIVASGHQDGVALRDGDGDKVDGGFFGVGLQGNRSVKAILFSEPNVSYPVGFDDAHVMAVNPEEERRECAGVYDTQTVRLAGLRRPRVVSGRQYPRAISTAQHTWKGSVAFSLNPVLPVTGSGVVPAMGPR